MQDRKTINLVIWLVGLAVLLFGASTVWLASRVLDQSSGAKTVDAAALGVLAIPAGFTTTSLGLLGGMLVSTRTTPNKEEIDAVLAPFAGPAAPPVNVNVTNTDRDPVPTADVAAAPPTDG